MGTRAARTSGRQAVEALAGAGGDLRNQRRLRTVENYGSLSRWERGRVRAYMFCKLGVISTIAGLLLAGCGGGATQRPLSSATPAASQTAANASAAPELQSLIDGARKEGQLNFVWGEGTEGGTNGIQKLAAGYNKQYGLDVKVQFTPGSSMPEMGAKMIQEVQTNRPATSDLYIGYAVHLAAAVQASALESVDWARWAPNLKDPSLVSGSGAAVTFETSLDGIGYNVQKLTGSLVPKTLQDLLNPALKGKLASTPYAANFDYLS